MSGVHLSTQDDRFREALSHEVTCPCDWCKEMWDFIDPDGEYMLPGEEPMVKS